MLRRQNYFCSMVKKNKLGIGAVCSSLKRYLYSRKDVDAKYLIAAQCGWLEGLIVVYQWVIKVNHKDQVWIVFETITSLTNAFIVLNDMQGL